ncbi:MAG: flagellar hook-basal body protein [Pseudomonadota bacterium]
MNGAFYIGSVGLDAQQRALDIIANNIANVNTSTFKRSDVRFAEIMSIRMQQPDALQLRDTATSAAGGVMASERFQLFSQGQIRPTGRATDLAIDGAGFIELLGAAGQTTLWRGGSLQINDEGFLTAENGMVLRDRIAVPDGVMAVQIASDGSVSAIMGNGEQPVPLGEIGLVTVSDAAQLERHDGGYYVPVEGARIDTGLAGENGNGLFVQGAVEGSNVELSEEMVEMMLVQRAFASNAQIVQAADQMMGIANSLRR